MLRSWVKSGIGSGMSEAALAMLKYAVGAGFFIGFVSVAAFFSKRLEKRYPDIILFRHSNYTGRKRREDRARLAVYLVLALLACALWAVIESLLFD